MSYYFTKLYNYYYDIHPSRPTEKEIRQKWMNTEQIKKTNFKFNRCLSGTSIGNKKNDNKIIHIKDMKPMSYETLKDSIKVLQLIKNKKKDKEIQKGDL